MYGEGWKQKEIRVAIDGRSGAYDDDPEQAGDSKPEKDHGSTLFWGTNSRTRTALISE